MNRLLGCALATLLALPCAAAAATEEPVRAVSLGAGDTLGRRMYGRALHRQAILARERGELAQRWTRPRPFDAKAWLEERRRGANAAEIAR